MSPRRTSAAGSLKAVLAYRNEAVVQKFLESFDLPPQEARDLFRETRKWLWLAARSTERKLGTAPPRRLTIDRPLLLLDEMWHVFILFTAEYSKFCDKHFGRYIHHAPTTWRQQERERRREARDPEDARQERQALMRAQYQFVYEQLGKATVLKWYSQYARKHTPDFIRRVRR